MNYDELYRLTTYEQYLNINHILTVIVNLVSLNEIEILGMFSGNIESTCFSKVKYRNLLNYKPILFENINLLKIISDNRHKVYIYSTILSSKPIIISYNPTTKQPSLNNCSKEDCPFKSDMSHGTYTLVDTTNGHVIPDPPITINETLGWNANNYIANSISLEKIKLYPCANISDLQKVIKYSSSNNIPLNIRGGGHSYANFSVRKENILIFTKLFSSTISTSITDSFHKIQLIDTKLYVGNNVRLGEIYLYLHNLQIADASNTSFDFPGGTCGNVGVAGYVLGGGQSYINSYTGPCCHYLYGVNCVNALGVKKTITEDNDSNTMYVLRGGGQIKPFVVTEFIFDLSGLESSKWYWKQVQLKNFKSLDVVKKILNYTNKNLKEDRLLGTINIVTQNKNISKIFVSFLHKNAPVSNQTSYKNFIANINILDCSNTIIGNTLGIYLWELYNTEFPPLNSWNGTISTMWEWGNDPNQRNSSYYNYTVNRTWSSIMGTTLGFNNKQKILNNSFMELNHYVWTDDVGGPYKNNSVFPPTESFTGWTMQLYTSDTEDNSNDIEDSLTNILTNSGGSFQYKYPNYPPTYKLNILGNYNSLDLYFNKQDIDVINKIKQQHDPSNMFVSDYEFTL